MSRQMKIVNGPNFRHLAFGTGLFDDNDWDSTFTMDHEIPCRFTIHKDLAVFQLKIRAIGRIQKDKNEFLVLASLNGGCSGESGKGPWFYVMHYNVQTRQGQATEYDREEFFASSVTREMFQAK